MPNQILEPGEYDSIECHLQRVGMGTLVCRAARQTGEHTTNEVNPAICYNCLAGKIYREVGCDAVLPKIRFLTFTGGSQPRVENLFCRIRKRNTTPDFCQTCDLVTAETTRQLITTARGLFQAEGFYAAYKDLEKARESIRDGYFESAITHSTACLESTMRICHEKLGKPLPTKAQVTDLWKSTRAILEFDSLDQSGMSPALMNSLTGTVSHLGGLRNALADAHGRGLVPPDVPVSIAELAINTASTLATMVVRRFNQVRGMGE